MADSKTKTEQPLQTMKLTAEDLKKLSAPFPKDKIGIKVATISKQGDKAMLVPYLQHTYVADRIEEVDPSWSSAIISETYGQKGCATSMALTIKGVTRANVGEGDEPKGAASDALKRCAMLFGIGRDFYDSGRSWVPYDEGRDKFRTWTYDDYEKGLRHGEQGVPTAEGTQARAATQNGQAFRATQLNPPKPQGQAAARGSAPASAPTGATPIGHGLPPRARLNAKLADLVGKLNTTMADIADWVRHDYGKEPGNLTLPELEQFVGILEVELGRKGEPA
jgi:hypothetical protein